MSAALRGVVDAAAQEAILLTPKDSDAVVRYARHYPTVARVICHKTGYCTDGSEEDYRRVGQEAIPFSVLWQKDK